MMKRIGIFLLYDTKGRVYEYVEYLLQQIRPCLEELVIVSNGFLLEESREALHKYTPKILERPNVGFDAAGWREGMLEYCGMDYIRDFDELVLFNDSFFGPFYPFQKIFDEMDARDIDFIGGSFPATRLFLILLKSTHVLLHSILQISDSDGMYSVTPESWNLRKSGKTIPITCSTATLWSRKKSCRFSSARLLSWKNHPLFASE